MYDENGALFESFPWTDTSLGRPESWPPEMLGIVRMALHSAFPICTGWGPDFLQIYNRAYNPIYGDKHPAAFGAPARESWTEIWEFLGSALNEVYRSGEPLWFQNTLLPLAKHGRPEECYFDFSYSAIHGAAGDILGVTSVAVQKTDEVIFRRHQSIQDLSPAEGAGPDELSQCLRTILEGNEMDAAGAVLYSADAYTGAPDGELWTLRIEGERAQALRPAVAAAGGSDLSTLSLYGFSTAASAEWGRQACVVPLRGQGQRLFGLLLLIPHRLVSLERSHKRFAQGLANRFHSLLERMELHREELRHAHRAKAERDTLYRFLFEHMHDAAFYCATSGEPQDDEIILEVNTRACDLLGYSRDELIGMSRGQLHFPDDPVLTGALEQRAAARSFLGRLTLRRKDGQAVPVEVTSDLIPLPDGSLRSLSLLRDNSLRIAAEEERSERLRLEGIATLTGGIAHDFNNLLTVILGNSDLLVSDLRDHGSRNLAEGIVMAAQRAGDLTNQLLAYSRRQTLALHPLDLAAFVNEVLPLLRSSLGEINSLELELATGLPPCLADPTQLTTALLNLVINARDAMPEGGRVTVQTALRPSESLPPHIDHHRLPRGQYVVLSVTDTGSGIAPEIRNRLFEPYFTTKGVGEGSGLGLPMVQGFMRQLGGDIRVGEASGGGTRIDLAFPLFQGEGTEATVAMQTGAAMGQTVLYAEDNSLVREQTAAMLQRLGFDPVIASNGREALALYQEASEVDLLLTDLVMPGKMSGLQLAQALRRLQPALPVVITTGHDLSRSLNSAPMHDINLLRKPYTLEALSTTLLSALSPTAPTD
ncbi:ATP-binding protein [Aquibaculum sediminis]|uniref:ATP-binding protein n=1 Tax=Aquibaculum sediminis TaxID=3231907 RepID=UPI003456959D